MAKKKTESAMDGKKLGSDKENEMERFRSNLLSVVSHELNTPLTGVFNALSMLEERFPKENEFIPLLRRSADRLKRTVDNLLDLAKADAGALRVRLEELDLANLLNSRKAHWEGLLEKEGMTLLFNIEEDLPHVCGDRRRLSFVLDSLVSNAAKFSHKAKKEGEASVRVTLSLQPIRAVPPAEAQRRDKKTGMVLLIGVQSSLPSLGESPESYEQLFEPFTPWRDADTRMKDGLGAELALAREILMAHDGYIWASGPSPENDLRGWLFSLALPLLSRNDELDLVVHNRLHSAIGALSKLSLFLLKPEPGHAFSANEERWVSQALRKALFRSSDSIFFLPDVSEYVILMDDCDREGAEKMADRLSTVLKGELPHLPFIYGIATGPDQGSSCEELLTKARHGGRPWP
jgi:nitrogen-specific signal transduction histidine kinase